MTTAIKMALASAGTLAVIHFFSIRVMLVVIAVQLFYVLAVKE